MSSLVLLSILVDSVDYKHAHWELRQKGPNT